MAGLIDLSQLDRGRKPRDLLIVTSSQMQRSCLATYGGMVPVPAFERLAARGVDFDRLYCAASAPAPARVSLQSGRWPHSHGVISQDAGYAPKAFSIARQGEQWIVDRLLEAGYTYGYDGVGAVERDADDDRRREYAHYAGDDFPYGRMAGALIAQGGTGNEQYGPPVSVRTDNGPMRIRVSVPLPTYWPEATQKHPDYRRAQRVADFILSAPADKPLSVHYMSAAPHLPLLVPREYMEMFTPADVSRPPGFGEDMWDKPAALATNPHHCSVLDWDWGRWASAIAAYYGYVAFADACCAMVLDAMEAAGRLDDAVVAITTTCGEMLGAHHTSQFAVPYEDAIALPLVLAAPELQPGRYAHICSSVDVAPTLMELAGLPPLSLAQGTSLLPLLADPSTHGRAYVFSTFDGYIRGGWKWRAVITAAHKYVYYHDDRVDQLFDLRADPHELQNVSQHPKYFDTRRQLRAVLAAWMEQTGDFITPEFPE